MRKLSVFKLSPLIATVFLSGCLSTVLGGGKSVNGQQAAAHRAQHSSTEIRDYSRFYPREHNKKLNGYVEQMILDFDFYETFEKPIAVASFVEFDESLKKTNRLGNQLAEAFLVEMNQAGYPVADVTALDGVIVDKSGSFAFSRKQGKQASDLCCALSGNLIYQSDGVLVNSKVFELDTKRVLATSSVVIPYFVVEHLGQAHTR